jgi:hypothetical protein
MASIIEKIEVSKFNNDKCEINKLCYQIIEKFFTDLNFEGMLDCRLKKNILIQY